MSEQTQVGVLLMAVGLLFMATAIMVWLRIIAQTLSDILATLREQKR